MPAQPNIVPSAFKLAFSVAGARQVHELALPIVLSSFNTPTGMDTPTFTEFAQLSGLVPLVGITSGRCFAGHTSRGRVCR